MRVQNFIIAGALLLGAPAGSVAVAQASACGITHTDKTSVTSTGSWSHTVTDKRTCGHSYTSHQWRLFRSYTGAHSVTWVDKWGTMSPSHYREHLVRDSWSRTHKLTVTDAWITR